MFLGKRCLLQRIEIGHTLHFFSLCLTPFFQKILISATISSCCMVVKRDQYYPFKVGFEISKKKKRKREKNRTIASVFVLTKWWKENSATFYKKILFGIETFYTMYFLIDWQLNSDFLLLYVELNCVIYSHRRWKDYQTFTKIALTKETYNKFWQQ